MASAIVPQRIQTIGTNRATQHHRRSSVKPLQPGGCKTSLQKQRGSRPDIHQTMQNRNLGRLTLFTDLAKLNDQMPLQGWLCLRVLDASVFMIWIWTQADSFAGTPVEPQCLRALCGRALKARLGSSSWGHNKPFVSSCSFLLVLQILKIGRLAQIPFVA